MVVRDDTYTVIGGAESTELVNTGSATISGPGYPQKNVDVTDYSTDPGGRYTRRDEQPP